LSAATDRRQIARHVGDDGAVVLLPADTGIMVKAPYPAFDGEIANGPHLRLGLNTGRRARLAQQVGSSRLEGWWQPGAVAITPPDCIGIGACGAVDMIGLAIVPGAATWTRPIDLDHIDALSCGFIDDALLAAVLTALHHEADLHGASTAFFQHGVALIFQRLSELVAMPFASKGARPLSQGRFDRLIDYVDSCLSDDLSVIAMAAVTGMDPSGFTRALRARTGLAPYAWLTERRMAHARQLLIAGLPVTSIAAQVGYANASKFAAAFTRMMGSTPSRWREGARFPVS
jgi:AraC family transcriptional regulator